MGEQDPPGHEITCPVCLDLFNDPVSLLCGHSLCRSCIPQTSKAATSIRCFACGETSTIPETLEGNVQLQQHVDMMTGRAGLEESLVCDRCEETTASLACEQCDMVFCADCHAAHHVGKVLKSHTVGPIDEMPNKNIPFCEIPGHGRCRKELLCTEDDQLLCVKCLQLDNLHYNKRCVTLSSAIESYKGELASYISSSETKVVGLRSTSETVNDLCIDLAKRTSDEVVRLRSVIQQLKNELDKKEEELVNEALAHKEEEISKLSATKWEVFARAASVNNHIALAKRTLAKGQYQDMRTVTSSLKEVDTAVTIPSVSVASLRTDPSALNFNQFVSFNVASPMKTTSKALSNGSHQPATPFSPLSSLFPSNAPPYPVRSSSPGAALVTYTSPNAQSRPSLTQGDTTARTSPSPPMWHGLSPRDDGKNASVSTGEIPSKRRGPPPPERRPVSMKPHTIQGMICGYTDGSTIITIDGETGQHTTISQGGYMEGIHYFEVNVAKISDGSWIGVSHENTPEASYVGAHGLAWGSSADGRQGYLHSAFPDVVVSPKWTHLYREGTTVGVLLDMDDGTLGYFLDGQYLGIAACNLKAAGAPVHLAVSNNNAGAQYIVCQKSPPRVPRQS